MHLDYIKKSKITIVVFATSVVLKRILLKNLYAMDIYIFILIMISIALYNISYLLFQKSNYIHQCNKRLIKREK